MLFIGVGFGSWSYIEGAFDLIIKKSLYLCEQARKSINPIRTD